MTIKKEWDYEKKLRNGLVCIYDKDLIASTIERFVVQKEDTSILILSDDSALNEDIDANALGNLVYVRDIINTKKETLQLY